MDDVNALFHLQALCIAVPYPDTALVLRVGLVVGVEPSAVLVFKVGVLFPCLEAVEGELNVSQIIGIGTINALDGGVG